MKTVAAIDLGVPVTLKTPNEPAETGPRVTLVVGTEVLHLNGRGMRELKALLATAEKELESQQETLFKRKNMELPF